MEQSCYKCRQLVEEGRPFCPHCGAPQIRVLVAEPVAAAPLASSLDSQVEAVLPASQTVPVLALPIRWSQTLRPCFLAALVSVVLMFLGLSPFVAMVSAGFLSIVFYRQGRPVGHLRLPGGLRLGAFGGLLCFGLIALMTALAAMVPELRMKLHDEILSNAQKWVGAHPGDPQLQGAIDQLKTPEGFMMAMILGGFMLLVVAIVLGGLGGAAGAAIFGRRERR